MPGRKRKVPGPDGQMREATELTFNASGEHWNEYLVEDGTVIKLKTVVTEIVRIDDMYDGEGNPVYLAKSQNILAVNSPDSVRRQGDEG